MKLKPTRNPRSSYVEHLRKVRILMIGLSVNGISSRNILIVVNVLTVVSRVTLLGLASICLRSLLTKDGNLTLRSGATRRLVRSVRRRILDLRRRSDCFVILYGGVGKSTWFVYGGLLP